MKRLFAYIEGNLSCPKCKNITCQNLCTRACAPWMAIECSECGNTINGSAAKGFIQVIFSAVIMYLTAITVASSEIYYPRIILSSGLGGYTILGFIFVAVCGIGKCD